MLSVFFFNSLFHNKTKVNVRFASKGKSEAVLSILYHAFAGASTCIQWKGITWWDKEFDVSFSGIGMLKSSGSLTHSFNVENVSCAGPC